MAKLQALKQQRSIETMDSPVTSTQVEGGFTSGVPKMHPLKSSNPVFKAGNMLHSLRIKKFGSSMIHPIHLPKI